MTDTPLIARARAGDREALGELLARHAPALRRALHGAIPARWQALLSIDDVTQDTYVDVFLDIATFVPVGEGAFLQWLVTIAKRNLLDALKSLEAGKRGGDRTPQRVPRSSLDALCETPSGTAAAKEAAQALEQVIARLPESYRSVIAAYDLERRPIEAVAAQLGRSEGAVYLLRNRAHRRLRELLGRASRFFSRTP